MLLTKDFETVQEAVKPQDPDLLAIRKYAQRDLTADEVWCSAFKACNTKRDRSGEQFTKTYLERFRDTLPGKGVLEGHRRDARPIGRIYAAEVLPEGPDWYLKSYWYTAADSPIRREVELGIARDCSIGYAAGKRICSIDQKMWLPYRQGECKDHQPLQEYDGQECTIHYCDSEAHKAEGQELSLVWMGCQYGAEATAKQYAMGWVPAHTASLGTGIGTAIGPEFWNQPLITPQDVRSYYSFPPTATPREDSGMYKTIEEAEVEIKRLQTLPLAADRETELVKQITDLQAKAPLADDGVKFRAHLNAEIGRLAALMGKAATYERLLTHMKDAGADSLQPVLDELLAEYDAKFSTGTGHTNGPPPDNANDKAKKPGVLGRLAGGYF